MSEEPRAVGIDALVARLHSEGVEAGRAEAERIVADARTRAEALLADAHTEAERLHTDARADAERLEEASKAALQLAFRDTMIKTREALTRLMADRLAVQVRAELAEPGLLAELVRRSAAVLTGDAAAFEVRVGSNLEVLEAVAERVVRDIGDAGLTLLPGEDGQAGVVARRVDGKIEVELSDRVIAAHLFAHLQPRIRQLLDGKIEP